MGRERGERKHIAICYYAITVYVARGCAVIIPAYSKITLLKTRTNKTSLQLRSENKDLYHDKTHSCYLGTHIYF